MTTGTLRNEGEVTSFSPGVAQKLHLAPVGFLETYRLPSGRGKDIQESSVILVSLSRRLSQPRFPTWDSKVIGQRDMCRKTLSLLCFSCEFHRDVHMIQYENKILYCTITFSYSKLCKQCNKMLKSTIL